MGLIEDVKEIKEKLADNEKAKEKKFRFPFGKKVGKGQRKKNYVTVLTIYENGICIFNKYQIKDQTIIHELIPRLATTGHTLRDKKGNPVMILPNWSVEPFSPLEHLQKSFIDGSNKKGYAIIMERMLATQSKPKKEMGAMIKWILGLGLVGVIAWAFLSGGGN